MYRFPYDLHAHTDFSDGDSPPEYVIRQAKRLGLKGIVICDHNTTRATQRALTLAQHMGLHTMEGIEISARHLGVEMHLTAYAHTFRTVLLEHGLQKTQRGYTEKVKLQMKRAKELGLARLTMRDLRRIRPHAPFFVKYDIARALAKKTKSPVQTITRRLNRGGDLFVPYGSWALTPHEVIDLAHRAHGIVSIAHLGSVRASLYKKYSARTTDRLLTRLVASLVKQGLRGLELRHPDHTDDDERFISVLLRRFHLLPTGGSDYHGEKHHPERPLGIQGVYKKELDNWYNALP